MYNEFNYQTLPELIERLQGYKELSHKTDEKINEIIEKLENDNKNWSKTDVDFRIVVTHTRKFLSFCAKELEDVLHELNYSVAIHHIERLRKMANMADQVEEQVARIWGSLDSYYDEDGNLERELIYTEARGTLAELANMGWMTNRLKDFLGIKQDIQASFLKNVILGEPSSESKFQCDLFMIMPFRDDLNPVYEDSIRPIAIELGMTIKRGDDPFSQHEIMHDIWSLINNCMY